MKKPVAILLTVFLAVSLCGCGSGRAANEDNVAAVQNVVTAFGERLKEVSLLAPEEVLVESIQNKYADYVSEELLAQWLASPSEAPGRVVSSPWPELIEIEDVTELSLQSYQVTGAVIEFTSVEQGTEDAGARRPIEVTVEKIDDQWRITAFTFGDREGATVYHNDEYGFTFSLPDSWQGFSVVSASWQGQSVENGEIIANGPQVLLRHPDWSAQAIRQDIPIMIFTHQQWQLVQDGQMSVGAAPIGPKELARNAMYVFALPARYNFSFPAGYEEVEEILAGKPLVPDAAPTE
ncbi:MAG TPA: hypothetical protein GXZ96_00615 [Firmicutes bacterium]|jgi:hypothetical protein|nr:hypothetical protein [Bacillota bacterium]